VRALNVFFIVPRDAFFFSAFSTAPEKKVAPKNGVSPHPVTQYKLSLEVFINGIATRGPILIQARCCCPLFHLSSIGSFTISDLEFDFRMMMKSQFTAKSMNSIFLKQLSRTVMRDSCGIFRCWRYFRPL